MKDDTKILYISVGIIAGVGAAVLYGLLTGNASGTPVVPTYPQYAPLTEPTCNEVD
jgi:hypothetical protein